MKKFILALFLTSTLLADEAVVLPEADPGEPPIGTASIIASEETKNHSIVVGASITAAVALVGILVATLSPHGQSPPTNHSN